uniref:Uncharacterized protein n=1 Tax=Anguilla anguilla TaxID=7936 RepID=A0A0E9TG91_ANGAN
MPQNSEIGNYRLHCNAYRITGLNDFFKNNLVSCSLQGYDRSRTLNNKTRKLQSSA